MSPSGTRLFAGAETALAQGEVRVLPLPRHSNGTPREALLLRDLRGQPRAYLNRCRHLPVTLDAGGRTFLSTDGRYLECRTHGASYRLDDGHCVRGPCIGLALEAIPIEVEAGSIYIVIEG